MRKLKLMLALLALSIGVVAAPLGASSNVPHVSDWAISPNLTALGFSANPVPLEAAAPDDGVYNSDLAFWGDMAVQGTYDGFVLHDITFPSRPKVILNYTDCYPQGNRQGGNQGDITIWGNILVRSSNSNAGAGQTCDGDPVPVGFEGLIVFDISNKLDPDVVAMVDLPCGSHTQTLVPDTANGRVLIYNSSTTGVPCAGLEIVEIPLANPAGAHFVRFEPSGDPVPPLPNVVTVNAPSPAAGTYVASGANWGTMAPEAGIAGSFAVVNGPDAEHPGRHAFAGLRPAHRVPGRRDRGRRPRPDRLRVPPEGAERPGGGSRRRGRREQRRRGADHARR